MTWALQEGGWEGAFLCDALLRACAALGEAQLTLLTVRSMHALGIPVGYVAHGCVLTCLGRAGRLQVRHSLVPPLHTCLSPLKQQPRTGVGAW